MTLQDLFLKIDKRKSKITLYKVYNIQSYEKPILDKPLEVDIGLDFFGTTPEASLEYVLKQNEALRNKMVEDIGTLLSDEFRSFFNDAPIDITQNPDDKDDFTVNFKEIWVDHGGKTAKQFAYVVSFTIPFTELERLPACYDAGHNLIEPPNCGRDIIALTLLDRDYEMGVKVYEMKSFHIKNTQKGCIVKDLEMQEVSPVPAK